MSHFLCFFVLCFLQEPIVGTPYFLVCKEDPLISYTMFLSSQELGGGPRYSVFWNFGRGNYFHLLKVAYMAGAEKSTGRGSEKRLEFWQKIVCPLKKTPGTPMAYGLCLLLDLCSACRKSQMRMYLPD